MARSLVNVVAHTATGGIDEISIPKSVAVAIRPRSGTALIYDEDDGTEYYTIAEGSMLTINSSNMEGDKLYIKGAGGAIIELVYQTRG